MAILVRFVFQAEDGIRDLVRSRGLGDVYKRQVSTYLCLLRYALPWLEASLGYPQRPPIYAVLDSDCLLYTSDAADERSSVDLGGRRIIKKKMRAELRMDSAAYLSVVDQLDRDTAT